MVSDNNECYKSDVEEFEKVKQIIDTQLELFDFVNCDVYLQTSTILNIDDIILSIANTPRDVDILEDERTTVSRYNNPPKKAYC